MNDGGPAFPNTRSPHLPGSAGAMYEPIPHPGMSLRDYFAVRLMAALYVAPMPITKGDVTISNGIQYADCAYELADALLAARDRSNAARMPTPKEE